MYRGRPIQGGQKESMFCTYWVYNKPFIYKYPYIKEPHGKIFEFVTTKATSVPTNKKSC